VGLWLDDTINQPVIDNLYYQYHLFAEKLTTEKKLRSVFIHKDYQPAFLTKAVASGRRCLEMRGLPTESTAGVLEVRRGCSTVRRGCSTEGSRADSSAYARVVGDW
jgi:hypothetical protein